MKTLSRRLLFLLFVVLSQNSCTVSLGQINEFRRDFPIFIAGSDLDTATKWSVKFLEAELVVHALSRPDGSITFSGDEGLRIEFDGEEITEMSGFPGAFGRYEVRKKGLSREIKRDGWGAYQVTCSRNREWRVSPTKSGRRTECRGIFSGVSFVTQNTLTFDKQGTPLTITSTISPGTRPIEITRLAD